MNDLEREVEETSAACMRAQGFEYTPNVSGRLAADVSFEAGDREFAETYGFGLVANLKVNPQTSDPNVEHLATLSGTEAEAYARALLGDIAETMPPAEAMTVTVFDIEDGLGGCKGEAFDESFGFVGVLFAFDDTAESDLTPEAQAEIDAIQADEIAAAVASWDCGEGMRSAIDKANLEIERRIVDEHGDAIVAMLNEGA